MNHLSTLQVLHQIYHLETSKIKCDSCYNRLASNDRSIVQIQKIACSDYETVGYRSK